MFGRSEPLRRPNHGYVPNVSLAKLTTTKLSGGYALKTTVNSSHENVGVTRALNGKNKLSHQRITLCKILVVGNAKCGKTSLIRRFTSHKFDSKYSTTIGTDFARKDIEIDNLKNRKFESSKVRLQLWDIAGQDRFAKLTRAYFRNAKAAAIVCDLTREGTFEAVRQWKAELDKFNFNIGHSSLPVVLFANKCDLLADAAESFVAGAKMEALCRELGIVTWFVTSAKNGVNVEEGFQLLASSAVEIVNPNSTRHLSRQPLTEMSSNNSEQLEPRPIATIGNNKGLSIPKSLSSSITPPPNQKDSHDLLDVWDVDDCI